MEFTVTMQSPPPDTSSTARTLAAIVGALVGLIGFVQTIGALVFAVELIESDRSGGLFGFRVGMLMVVFVCVPLAALGTLEVIGGVGSVRQKRWGFVVSLVAAVLNAGGAAIALLFSLGNMPGSSVSAVAAAVLAINIGVMVVMLRALASMR
ncbi:MAG: hypothetical protein JNK05_25035 [Myxococcales bacterium]|nr:hypothetical protein [Myxococcales bacterium]